MAILRFLRSNILYLMWFAIHFFIAYVIFGEDERALLIVGAIYAVSIGIALSPIGEIILRLIQGCKKPQTKQDSEYLIPLFEEVYEDAKIKFPQLSKHIKIHVIDEMYVNACAIGRNTIAVTRGALETFSREELKGVIAHELGHMVYGHTKALMLIIIGNFIFTVFVWIAQIIMIIAQFISNIIAYRNLIGLIFIFVAFVTRLVFQLFLFVFVNLGEMIIAVNSRFNELQADKFAHDIGFGKQLIQSLYLLQKITIRGRMNISQILKSTHPHLIERISALEQLEDKAYA